MARIELAGAVLLCPREEVGCGAVERRSYVAGPILPPQKMGGAAAQLAGVGCSRRRNRAALSRGALGPEPAARRSRRESRRTGRLDGHRDHADRAAAAKLAGCEPARADMSFAASFGLSLLALFVLPALVSGCLPDGRSGRAVVRGALRSDWPCARPSNHTGARNSGLCRP
jgi:hypothetical protein